MVLLLSFLMPFRLMLSPEVNLGVMGQDNLLGVILGTFFFIFNSIVCRGYRRSDVAGVPRIHEGEFRYFVVLGHFPRG